MKKAGVRNGHPPVSVKYLFVSFTQASVGIFVTFMPLFPLLFHGFRVINNTTQSPACQKNGGGRGKQNNQEDTL
jgi:hypothetical protein